MFDIIQKSLSLNIMYYISSSSRAYFKDNQCNTLIKFKEDECKFYVHNNIVT